MIRMYLVAGWMVRLTALKQEGLQIARPTTKHDPEIGLDYVEASSWCDPILMFFPQSLVVFVNVQFIARLHKRVGLYTHGKSKINLVDATQESMERSDVKERVIIQSPTLNTAKNTYMYVTTKF